MSGAGDKKHLSEAPTIHPEAKVSECKLGAWTEVGKGTMMREAEMGDYSYITQQCHVVWTTIGKFCSIANATRLNPGNHPTWRVAQHHSVYRSEAYGLGEDDHDFFKWRKDHWGNHRKRCLDRARGNRYRWRHDWQRSGDRGRCCCDQGCRTLYRQWAVCPPNSSNGGSRKNRLKLCRSWRGGIGRERNMPQLSRISGPSAWMSSLKNTANDAPPELKK